MVRTKPVLPQAEHLGLKGDEAVLTKKLVFLWQAGQKNS